MEAKELRIGNLVKWKEKDIAHEVLSVSENGRIHTCPISIGKLPDDYEPIPLTEEWLLKLGFELLNFDSFDYDGYKILSLKCGKLRLDADSSNDYKTIEHKYFPVVQYVHQLQNLYRCLTGKELFFKL